MPRIPRQYRKVPEAQPRKQDVEPVDVAPLASPDRKIPEPSLPEIPELPMTLAPPRKRQSLTPKATVPATKRPGLPKLSIRNWDVPVGDVVEGLHLESE